VWVQLACWEDTYHVPSQGLCLSGATRDAQKLFLSCVVNELSLWAELNTCLYVLDLEADVGILPYDYGPVLFRVLPLLTPICNS
jgi:hypothetical protein